MKRAAGKLTRRIEATRRVWRPGGGHMAMLAPPPAPPAEPPRAGPLPPQEPELLPLPSGFIDVPGPGSVLSREPFRLRGWALFPAGPATRVDLWLGGLALGPARLGGHRPDIQGYYGFRGMTVEWEHVVDLAELELPEGEIVVRAVATGPEGEVHELPPSIAFVAPEAEPEPAPPPRVAVAMPARRGGGLRVVALTHRLDLGGAQLILLDLLLGLRRSHGVESAVVSPLDGELRQAFEAAGIEVHVTGPAPVHDPVLYGGRTDELAAWIGARDFDVALVNTSLAFAGADAAGRAGLPTLWAIHESHTPSTLWRGAHPEMHPEVRRRADAALAAAALAIFEADATRRMYAPFVGGRCLTVPYGLDFAALEAERARFDPARARAERLIGQDAKVVVAIGTAEPRKAQIPLVQAFGRIAGRHPGALLVVIGAGTDDYSRALHAYARDCPWADRVRVLPLLADTAPWYGLADLMVCASDLESLPRSVLEAMWWETPVVATDIFGLPDVIEPGRTGWLCPPRDVAALADALDAALGAPPAQRAAIVSAARALVQERHDLGDYVAACESMLRELVPVEAPARRLGLAR